MKILITTPVPLRSRYANREVMSLSVQIMIELTDTPGKIDEEN